MPPDDQRSAFQTIDQATFNQLFLRNQRWIFAHILTLLPRLADAEEVFQRTCLVILDKAGKFTPGTDFAGWARQIAKYEVYNYRRQLAGERLHFDSNLLEEIAACQWQDSEVLDAELAVLRKCVENLPASDRQLIQRRYARRITSRTLAAELGRPVNTVYKALVRIHRALRECVHKAISRQAHATIAMPADGPPPAGGDPGHPPGEARVGPRGERLPTAEEGRR